MPLAPPAPPPLRIVDIADNLKDTIREIKKKRPTILQSIFLIFLFYFSKSKKKTDDIPKYFLFLFFCFSKNFYKNFKKDDERRKIAYEEALARIKDGKFSLRSIREKFAFNQENPVLDQFKEQIARKTRPPSETEFAKMLKEKFPSLGEDFFFKMND